MPNSGGGGWREKKIRQGMKPSEEAVLWESGGQLGVATVPLLKRTKVVRKDLPPSGHMRATSDVN